MREDRQIWESLFQPVPTVLCGEGQAASQLFDPRGLGSI